MSPGRVATRSSSRHLRSETPVPSVETNIEGLLAGEP
jgi:hypothetical protein